MIRQPNPYMLDGTTAYLSDDIRVFQVSQSTPPPFPTNAAIPTDEASALTFIQTVLGEFDANPARFESIATGYGQSWLELSPTRQQQPVFNFAIARVRYAEVTVPATDVRVFFRLFTTAATNLDYHVNLSYKRSAPFGAAAPLLGAPQNGMLTTLPFFAVPRVDVVQMSMTDQVQNDVQGVTVKTLPAAQGVEQQHFFGAWLDINQPSVGRFPPSPTTDGPWAAGTLASIQSLIRGRHQCIVGEIYFVPTATTGDPTPEGATPASSENLAQRNLAGLSWDRIVLGTPLCSTCLQCRCNAAEPPCRGRSGYRVPGGRILGCRRSSGLFRRVDDDCSRERSRPRTRVSCSDLRDRWNLLEFDTHPCRKH